jgi:hypothetical protein
MRLHGSEIRSQVATATLLLALTACGGGSGDSGAPPPAPPALQPTLASIQANIFTPTCAVPGCHSGTQAMLGLRLDAGFSYDSLVNKPSFYDATLTRVVPGNADASFLIQKLEGTEEFGQRMPLNGPYFQQTTVDIVRQWIDQGAQP